MIYTYSAPCLMGVEGLVADELKFGGFDNVRAENGRVLYDGDIAACARANVTLRCAERVLIRVACFKATTFEQLFDGVSSIMWEDYVGKADTFPVKGYSIGSALHSVPACQKIIKKAIVERLKKAYRIDWFDETGPRRQVQFSLMNDMAEIYLDTTGAPLYKRGYKLEQNEATIRETLAASMVKLARYRGREVFIDPMCGSGTIAIEAALAALNIAPGARRAFDAESWGGEYLAAFDAAKRDAEEKRRSESEIILAGDNDRAAVELTRENARRAGVSDAIRAEVRDIANGGFPEKGVLMCNPPYGERMLDIESARELYAILGRQVNSLPDLKKYIISSDESFEKYFDAKADKRRKLYNGMIKCNLYMYFRG